MMRPFRSSTWYSLVMGSLRRIRFAAVSSAVLSVQ